LLDKHAALSYAAADILKEAVNEEISKAEAMEKINALEEEANEKPNSSLNFENLTEKTKTENEESERSGCFIERRQASSLF